ncbi:MAG: PaaI family thioesterase [Chitinophagales bacterium]|nr:PaaI family thioesterase [Chitinophagales bacterium]MBP9549560.1 PaaI family thioesterase [Chitinophagales bacterium]
MIAIEDIHYRRLEQMFLKAPVTQLFKNSSIEIAPNKCMITWNVDSHFFHAGKSLHGAAYFKMLDDAAYFAAASLNDIQFILTKTFQVKFIRPVTGGLITAEGISKMNAQGNIKATSVLRSQDNKILASGEGEFAISKLLLSDVEVYAL